MNFILLSFLRIYNYTLGRFNFFSNLMKMILIKRMILNKKRKNRHIPSSKFFSIDDL